LPTYARFFEKVLQDQADQNHIMKFAFGRMSATGENLVYFEVDGRPIIVDKQTGIEICEAMHNVAVYLGYDK
jgi:hypothetical protein